MRRLIAILMLLWLPLQAVAGISVSACASPVQVALALDAAVVQTQNGASHDHHASASIDATASHQASDDGAAMLHSDSTDPQCGDCAMACAAFAVHQVVSDPQPALGEGPTLHGEESFASATGNRALEPPIAAA